MQLEFELSSDNVPSTRRKVMTRCSTGGLPRFGGSGVLPANTSSASLPHRQAHSSVATALHQSSDTAVPVHRDGSQGAIVPYNARSQDSSSVPLPIITLGKVYAPIGVGGCVRVAIFIIRRTAPTLLEVAPNLILAHSRRLGAEFCFH